MLRDSRENTTLSASVRWSGSSTAGSWEGCGCVMRLDVVTHLWTRQNPPGARRMPLPVPPSSSCLGEPSMCIWHTEPSSLHLARMALPPCRVGALAAPFAQKRTDGAASSEVLTRLSPALAKDGEGFRPVRCGTSRQLHLPESWTAPVRAWPHAGFQAPSVLPRAFQWFPARRSGGGSAEACQRCAPSRRFP